MATDPERAAVEAAIDALQVAVLVTARLEADHAQLRAALVRAGAALATVKKTAAGQSPPAPTAA